VTDAAVETESIGRKVGRGLGWGLAGNVATKVLSFATSLTLARLLIPHDFGVFAVAAAAAQFVLHINDIGLIPATVQWRGRLEDMAPTAATIAASFSALVYAVFFFAAPSFAARTCCVRSSNAGTSRRTWPAWWPTARWRSRWRWAAPER
jgi:O-antigen/teichoic acid export membrane protein